MKTESTALVAIEDSSLETVAGGFALPALLDLDLKITKAKQRNEAVFAANEIVSYGDVTVVIEQSNSVG